MTTRKAKSGVQIEKDPDNRRTVILDRWPTEAEKNAGIGADIKKVRKG